jgi:hypothetical protein
VNTDMLIGAAILAGLELAVYGGLALWRDVQDERRARRLQREVMAQIAAAPRPQAPSHSAPLAFHWPALPYRRMN